VLDAFADDDVEKAHDVWNRDEEIDQVYTGLFRELLTYMMEDPRTITACTHLLFMAKNIERAGDHVTNIAELVSFRSTGQSFAEARRKGSGALYTTDRRVVSVAATAPRAATPDRVDQAARADRRGRDRAGRALALQPRAGGLPRLGRL
jgi:Na+/phosphate symporter